MPIFMQAADVLLFSLKNEPCFNLTVPSKVQFYMSQGKPILAIINGEGAELIKEANCGIAVNTGGVKELAEAIQSISQMENKELVSLGQNGKRFYEKKFAKSHRMEQLVQLFQVSEK